MWAFEEFRGESGSGSRCGCMAAHHVNSFEPQNCGWRASQRAARAETELGESCLLGRASPEPGRIRGSLRVATGPSSSSTSEYLQVRGICAVRPSGQKGMYMYMYMLQCCMLYMYMYML